MDKQTNLEMFNAHQAELRGRVDSLAKSMLLVSGSALSISFGVILRENGPKLNEDLWQLISSSWACLFVAMVSALFYLSIMIVRDNQLGEQWRKRIHKGGAPAYGFPGWLDGVIWGLGGLSLASIVAGMCLLFIVAARLVDVA